MNITELGYGLSIVTNDSFHLKNGKRKEELFSTNENEMNADILQAGYDKRKAANGVQMISGKVIPGKYDFSRDNSSARLKPDNGFPAYDEEEMDKTVYRKFDSLHPENPQKLAVNRDKFYYVNEEGRVEWELPVNDAEEYRVIRRFMQNKEAPFDRKDEESWKTVIAAYTNQEEEINIARVKADSWQTAFSQEENRGKVYVKTNEGAPYSELAGEDGMITYNGVTFVCDNLHRTLNLGDVSNPDDVLSIPLSGGGRLVVNRDNLGDLSKAIGMFSAEDVKRIMQAMAQDAKARNAMHEMEKEEFRVLDQIADGTMIDEKEEA